MVSKPELEFKIKELESKVLKQHIELLSFKDEEFAHINVEEIDDEGLLMLENMHETIGDDGLKLWLLRLFPAPKKTYNLLGAKLMSEVPEIPEYLAEKGHPEYLEIANRNKF
jgi:hypothetical protein